MIANSEAADADAFEEEEEEEVSPEEIPELEQTSNEVVENNGGLAKEVVGLDESSEAGVEDATGGEDPAVDDNASTANAGIVVGEETESVRLEPSEEITPETAAAAVTEDVTAEDETEEVLEPEVEIEVESEGEVTNDNTARFSRIVKRHARYSSEWRDAPYFSMVLSYRLPHHVFFSALTEYSLFYVLIGHH